MIMYRPADSQRVYALARNNFLSGLKVRDEGAGHLLKVIWVVSKLGLTTS